MNVNFRMDFSEGKFKVYLWLGGGSNDGGLVILEVDPDCGD